MATVDKKGSLKLPMELNLQNGAELTLDLLKTDQFRECYGLVRKSAGIGLGMDEFEDENSFQKFVTRAVSFALTDTRTGRCVGLYMIYPSPMCRSFRTKMAAGYIILDESHRGNGTFQELSVTLGFLWPLLGYHGVVARIRKTTSTYAEVNANYNASVGLLSTAVIPQSQLLKSGNRADDIIMIYFYPKVGIHCHPRILYF